MKAMNINAPHFHGWAYRASTEHQFPMVLMPSTLGPNMKPDALVIDQPLYMGLKVHDEIARLVAHAPELFRIAERFFSFYELHKSARGGQLGRDYEELRAKIMGAPRAAA